jgi:hypothetical protein
MSNLNLIKTSSLVFDGACPMQAYTGLLAFTAGLQTDAAVLFVAPCDLRIVKMVANFTQAASHATADLLVGDTADSDRNAVIACDGYNTTGYVDLTGDAGWITKDIAAGRIVTLSLAAADTNGDFYVTMLCMPLSAYSSTADNLG